MVAPLPLCARQSARWARLAIPACCHAHTNAIPHVHLHRCCLPCPATATCSQRRRHTHAQHPTPRPDRRLSQGCRSRTQLLQPGKCWPAALVAWLPCTNPQRPPTATACLQRRGNTISSSSCLAQPGPRRRPQAQALWRRLLQAAALHLQRPLWRNSRRHLPPCRCIPSCWALEVRALVRLSDCRTAPTRWQGGRACVMAPSLLMADLQTLRCMATAMPHMAAPAASCCMGASMHVPHMRRGWEHIVSCTRATPACMASSTSPPGIPLPQRSMLCPRAHTRMRALARTHTRACAHKRMAGRPTSHGLAHLPDGRTDAACRRHPVCDADALVR